MPADPQKPTPKGRNFFWPTIETIEDAEWATKQAFYVMVLCGVLTTVFAGLAVAGVEFVKKTLMISSWAFVDAALFGLIAFFLTKHSRVAAWSGLIMYLAERIFAMVATGKVGSPIIPAILTLGLIAGVRGTHAWHRLKNETPPDAMRRAA